MCWNEDISLNTFLFSCIGMIFIFITNTYTRYKTPLFDNPLLYVFAFFVASMQLLEFFMWKHLEDKNMNTFLSKVGLFILFAQMFTFILLVDDPMYRYSILSVFLLTCLFFSVYTLTNPIVFKTREAGGHLSWDWVIIPGLSSWMNVALLILFLSFYFVPALLMKGNQSLKLQLTIAGIFFFIFAYLVGKKEHTYGSLWCWAINFFFIYFVVNILIVQPFYEYNGLC